MAALEAREVRQRHELLARAEHVMRRRLALRAMQRHRLAEAREAKRHPAGEDTAAHS